MKRTWKWISLEATLSIHDIQLSEHGGIRGVRDLALIDSALARPCNQYVYGKPDAASLAAAYAFGLCSNHGFLDGNKRTAYAVAEVFLDLNGYNMTATDEDVVSAVLAVAAGVHSELKLAKWFRSYTITK